MLKSEKTQKPTKATDETKPNTATSTSSSRLNTKQRCYSKQLPMVQARREKIEEIIADLSQHPFALYSHLEESLPDDVSYK